ncbi:hypothetical protein HPB50_004947 [Hyalomma asiaticum]|uniref:Uncharacterized protein n=1 Tax=Hyalomma asiaticum TaxID=266040 RepID=A0ACB7RUP7_HYAAI|nr:hypothetical protein HPB50_004947 [Hyalomma asiaticum]
MDVVTCETWTAEYNGNVLASSARRACLADDAVPSIFPDCQAHLSKLTKHRKRPAVRQLVDVPSKRRVHRTNGAENAQEGDDLDESDCDRGGRSPCEISDTSDTAPVEVDGSKTTQSAERPREQVFNDLFELSAPSILPSLSWGYHR